jgi:hypothetical protein
MSYKDIIKEAREQRDQEILRMVRDGCSNSEIVNAVRCGYSTIYFIKSLHGLVGKVGRPCRKVEFRHSIAEGEK